MTSELRDPGCYVQQQCAMKQNISREREGKPKRRKVVQAPNKWNAQRPGDQVERRVQDGQQEGICRTDTEATARPKNALDCGQMGADGRGEREIMAADKSPKAAKDHGYENDVNQLVDLVTVIAQIKGYLFLERTHFSVRRCSERQQTSTSIFFLDA